MKKVLFLLTISTMSLSGYAQETNFSNSKSAPTEEKKPSPLDFDAGLETSHLSKGNVVYDGITATGRIHYAFDKGNHFTIGFWGGASFDAKSYHEIDYYLQYKTDHFIVAVTDIFNSSGMGKGNDQFPVVSVFDYDKNTSTHLIELNVVYILPKIFPLRIDIKSELYGRDKDKDEVRYGTGSNHNENRYSTYAELSYPVVRDQKVNLNLFLGAAFVLNGKAKTFLFNEIEKSGRENKFGIMNVGVKVTKNISMFEYKLPVSATAMWDPQNKYSRIQLDVRFF